MSVFVIRTHELWVLAFQIFQLIFLMLCEIDYARMIRVDRNSVGDRLFVVTQFVVLS